MVEIHLNCLDGALFNQRIVARIALCDELCAWLSVTRFIDLMTAILPNRIMFEAPLN
jgi:hypothetical protein